MKCGSEIYQLLFWVLLKVWISLEVFPDVVGAFAPAVSASLVKAVLAHRPSKQPDLSQKNSLIVR
jgi:hypothetical protein